MNRNPSTSIKPKRGTTTKAIKAQFLCSDMWKGLFATAAKEFGEDVKGLVGVSADRAFFQRIGDATPYSIAISAEERGMFY